MVGLAYARIRATFYGWSTGAEDTYAAQLDLLTKATAINPGYAFAYYVKSLALFNTRQFPGAIEAAQTAVALDPNAAYGYFAMGVAERAAERCPQDWRSITRSAPLGPPPVLVRGPEGWPETDQRQMRDRQDSTFFPGGLS
jgi:tetratricopeptide (TPR) repeat protein